MTLHMIFTISMMLIALTLFMTRLRIEYTSLLVLSILVLWFSLFPLRDNNVELISYKDLLLGFASPALLTVLCLLILGHCLVKTAAIDFLANIFSHPRLPVKLGIVFVFMFIFVSSALMNNTPVVLMFIPIILGLAKKLDVSESRFMIPLSYIAILGGTMTLIGSSTNILVNNAYISKGFEGFEVFSFLKYSLILGAVGILYIVFVMPYFLKHRSRNLEYLRRGDLFFSEIRISEKSRFLGSKLYLGSLSFLPSLTLRFIERLQMIYRVPFYSFDEVKANDVISIAGTRRSLINLSLYNIDFLNDIGGLQGRNDCVVEAHIPVGSRVLGASLPQVDLFKNHQCSVMGIRRHIRFSQDRFSDILLEEGDILLLRGSYEHLIRLAECSDVIVLKNTLEALPDLKKSLHATGIFVSVILLSVFGILPLLVSAFLGVFCVLALRVISFRELVSAIDSNIILIIVTSLAIGMALERTGSAALIGQGLIGLLEGFPVWMMLSVLFLCIALLTNVLSNNVCAVIFTPICINIAQNIGADVEMFVLMVLYASNMSFATPIGYQTNLLVMNAGGYKFLDFVVAGGPLIVCLWLTFTTMMYVIVGV